ncbi:MAG: nitrile hydratase subunit alpha [Acidimicrobiaceae bacterium]|jgi:nitrile hydratase|nr:nitrile hydratase subunit alpha [Acidimicrobiaceae bacterium]
MSGDHTRSPSPSPIEVRVAALEAALIDKGVVTSDTIEAIVQTYEHDIGPHLGARVVARAWTNPGYKERLLADGTAAIADLGLGGAQADVLVAVENTSEVHNVVVCTLCSCYPWPVLGLPPTWYKSPPYRSRVVREPRAVLAEFGLDVAPEKEIRVWDSSAEVRYLVVPERPVGTDDLSEEQLAAIVTRDAMIGVAVVAPPSTPAAPATPA